MNKPRPTRTPNVPQPPRYRPRLLTLRDGRQVTLRAITEADGAEIVQAFGRLSPAARYSRFMQHKKSLDLAVLERGLRPVPGEEFVFVATVPADDGIDIVGAARYLRAGAGSGALPGEPAGERCEFAITLVDDWCGSGLAPQLMMCLMRRARRDGYRTMEGLVMADNQPMLKLARRLGFEVVPVADDQSLLRVVRALAPRSRRAAQAVSRRKPAP
jgi:RimJ/RimL family protein N-acetyltransferase